jgi:hypothetical protein
MSKRKLIFGATALVLVAVVAWALGLFGGTDPALAELQQLGDQMFNRDLPDDQRDQLRDDFRNRMQSLSDEQRRAFFDANRGQWMGRIERRMDEFFAMSQADQEKRLDELLDRMNQPRTERRRDGNRGGWGNWRNMTDAQRDERAKRMLDRTSPKLRAQFTEFRRKLEDRAEARGMAAPNFRAAFGGRGMR